MSVSHALFTLCQLKYKSFMCCSHCVIVSCVSVNCINLTCQFSCTVHTVSVWAVLVLCASISCTVYTGCWFCCRYSSLTTEVTGVASAAAGPSTTAGSDYVSYASHIAGSWWRVWSIADQSQLISDQRDQRAVRQRSDYKISATKRYEPLRFLAGRKSTLALLCKQQHRQKLVAVYAFYFYFRYKIVVVHHIFHNAE